MCEHHYDEKPSRISAFFQKTWNTAGISTAGLGLKPHFNFHKDGKLFGFYLQVAAGQFIEVFKADPAAEIKHQRIHHFCFEVDDLDAMRDALIKHGVEVTPKKLGGDQTWQFWCKDPDGTDMEFQQYTAKSYRLNKTDCIVDW